MEELEERMVKIEKMLKKILSKITLANKQIAHVQSKQSEIEYILCYPSKYRAYQREVYRERKEKIERDNSIRENDPERWDAIRAARSAEFDARVAEQMEEAKRSPWLSRH